MKKRKDIGTCKLTGEVGQFVASHLLPKALTKADGLGPGLIQIGEGKIQRRASSWYDKRLVTSEGEAVLARYDDWAIRLLRDHKLVWSGWGPIVKLPGVTEIAGTSWGIRTLKGGDWKKLRLFFLSLLWRAAASNLREFAEIAIPPDHLERLRKMILSGQSTPLGFYPISLTQFSNLGFRHNLAPLAQTKIIPAFDDHPEEQEPIFRFYLDGLIIHISRRPEEIALDIGSSYVGNSVNLNVSTIPYESSAEDLNLKINAIEAYLDRPPFELPYGAWGLGS